MALSKNFLMLFGKFSLQAQDKKRLLTDRFVKGVVSCGGIVALGALVMIFIYLAWVVLPLFKDAAFSSTAASISLPYQTVLVDIDVSDDGHQIQTLSSQGQLDIWHVANPKKPQLILSQSLSKRPFISRRDGNQNYLALLEPGRQLTVWQTQFAQLSHQVAPQLTEVVLPPMDAFVQQGLTTDFAFAVTRQTLKLVTLDDSGELSLIQATLGTQDVKVETLLSPLHNPEQMLLTPDGQTLYLRQGNQLAVMVWREQGFALREVIRLAKAPHQVTKVQFLPGAYSLLVTTERGDVSQWFDVLKDRKRTLTKIRTFEVGDGVGKIITDHYHKGFYSFMVDGQVKGFYTTNHNQTMSASLFKQIPDLIALSNSESRLVSWRDGIVQIHQLHRNFPEVSLSALWQKIWYEGYPEPQFVWQSSSASDTFEPKLSLVPLTFGTLKAALFAMLFSAPIAVLGAIYTGYFMSVKMRRMVKPAIELMEALPTVIIGFVAGIWLAPLVEHHLFAALLLIVLLPLSCVVGAGVWSLIPIYYRRGIPSGWHALMVMPMMVVFIVLGMVIAPYFEQWWFQGDLRVFLAQYGIDYEQRNALIVGLAMGFAVIPTIFTIAEDAIFSVPKHLSLGSLALGATPWQTLIHVVLFTASPGIFSALMMGFGRAVGETMIVLMATGNTPLLDWSIFEGMRTLSATIAMELPESEVGSAHYRILFLSALILLAFTFAVNSLGEWVRQRLRDRYRSL